MDARGKGLTRATPPYGRNQAGHASRHPGGIPFVRRSCRWVGLSVGRWVGLSVGRPIGTPSRRYHAPMSDGAHTVTPADITTAARTSFDRAPDDRLKFLLQHLVSHLHAYAEEVRLTGAEWEAAIAFLTATGRACSDHRQEFVLLSDTLGVSMLVDALQHPTPPGATEST